MAGGLAYTNELKNIKNYVHINSLDTSLITIGKESDLENIYYILYDGNNFLVDLSGVACYELESWYSINRTIYYDNDVMDKLNSIHAMLKKLTDGPGELEIKENIIPHGCKKVSYNRFLIVIYMMKIIDDEIPGGVGWRVLQKVCAQD